MRKPRKDYTPVEKVAILRRHLLDHVPVSDLCDEHQLSPTLFYQWQKQFFENGPAAFERKGPAPKGISSGPSPPCATSSGARMRSSPN